MTVVVGAGVVGLTCAVRLAESGHAVRVVTREPPHKTTSAVAGAVWFPYLVEPRERVDPWAARTYRELVELARAAPDSGVVLRSTLALSRKDGSVPSWSAEVDDFRPVDEGELPAGYRYGWVATLPVVETPRYLPWLEARLTRAGGAIEVVPGGVPSLTAAGEGATLVVHCSGLGARHLAGDDTMRSFRGQVVVVENPGLDRVVFDDDDPRWPVYVIPRRDDCVVGGTSQPDEESLASDRDVTHRILARAEQLVPALAGIRILGEPVGLRPVRPKVRLEMEPSAAGPPVIHCYGHGGAGFTLAWGCADEVLTLAEAALTAAS